MILDEVLKSFSRFFRRYNDDFADRMHYLHTITILSVYLLFVTTKQYFGEPLQCAISTNSELNKYIHSICWINGTYDFEHLKNTQTINPNYHKKIFYYQWTIFIILFECALFSLPSFLWSFFVYLNGFNLKYVIKNILKSAYLNEYTDAKGWSCTQQQIDTISEHIVMSFLKQKSTTIARRFNLPKFFNDKLSVEERVASRRTSPNLKTKSSFPIFLQYLLVKLVYLTQLVSHFFLIGYVFDINYFHFAFYSARNFFFSRYEFVNKYFPKRSLCDVTFYQKFAGNTLTVVCSLPLNLFNEMFYFGFFFWLCLVGVFTAVSVFYWCGLFFKSARRKYVMRALQISEEDEEKLRGSYTAIRYLGEEASLENMNNFLIDKTGYSLMGNFDLFFNDVCSVNVVFLIKIIAINSTPLAARDILNSLWDHYLDIGRLKVNEPLKRPVPNLKRRAHRYEENDV